MQERHFVLNFLYNICECYCEGD